MAAAGLPISGPPVSALPAATAAERVWRRCAASRIDSLNVLRVAAFLVVLLDHFEVAGPVAGFGLPVFLLLTGFLTTRSLLSGGKQTMGAFVGGFWRRRARRLFPALYGYLLMSTALLVAGHIHVNWSHLTATILQAGNYYEAIQGPQESYLSHIWSLALQEQYVLVWPFVVLLVGRDLRKLTIATIVAIVMVWALRIGLVLAGTSQSYLYRAAETRADSILIGSLLALVVRRRIWTRAIAFLARCPVAALAGALLVLAISACLHARLGTTYRDTLGFIVDPIALSVLVVLLVTFADCPALGFTKWRWLSWLGTITYGMYLYHPLAIQAVLHVSPHRGPLQVLAAFALSTLAGAACYYLVERRFMGETPTARADSRRPCGLASPVPVVQLAVARTTGRTH